MVRTLSGRRRCGQDEKEGQEEGWPARTRHQTTVILAVSAWVAPWSSVH